MNMSADRKKLSLSIIILLAVFIIVNVLSVVYISEDSKKIEILHSLGEKIIAVAAVDDNQELAATFDNELLLLKNGNVIERIKFDNSIAGMAVTEDKSEVIIGCADKNVYFLDISLKIIGTVSVNGRVNDLALLENGNIAVVYGQGVYTSKYYLGIFNPDGKLVNEINTGYTTVAVQSSGDRIFIGTSNSRVKCYTVDGKLLWEKVLKKPVRDISFLLKRKHILISDEGGSIYMMDATGRLKWSADISEYPITSIGFDENEETAVAGDKDGSVYVLDMENGKLVDREAVFNTSVSAILPHKRGSVGLVSYGGQKSVLDLSAASRAHIQNTWKIIMVIFNLFWILAVIACLVLFIEKLRKRFYTFWKEIRKSRLCYLMILPTVVMALIFGYYPVITSFYYSFMDFTLARPMKFVGIENYIKLAGDPYFWTGMSNLVIVLITAVIKVFTAPLLVAELIFWLRNKKHQYFFRSAFVVESIVPGVVIVLLWRMMYDPTTGLINNIFDLAGLDQLKSAWLGDPKLAIWSIVFSKFPWVSAFPMLIYYGGLINISEDLYDAANIDGVNVWQRFWKIDIPMIAPQLGIILFFTYMGSINTYSDIWVYTRGGPGYSTYVPALHMFERISGAGNYGYASAIGVILSIIVFAGTILSKRFKSQNGGDLS